MQKFLRTLTFVALLCVPWVAQGQTVVTIGEGTNTSNYLPTYNYYNYSFTQQIYTASEVGMPGLITSVAFKNTGTEKTRTLNIYMAQTTKTSFTSTNDWVAVSASNQVFTGSVTFTSGQWTTITLSTPFVYDGSSNLLISVSDVTGSYSSSPHMTCLVTDATNQALYAYRDSPGAYDVTNPGVTGTRPTSKNQIQLTISPLSGYCPIPGGLAARNITSNSADITWSISSYFTNVSSVAVEYGPQGFTPGTGTVATISDGTAFLTNLTPATSYQAYAVTDCDADGYSDTSWVAFRTKALPVDVLPYFTGFEPGDDLNWEFRNTTTANANGWYIDTAVADSGDYSMYISKDNGLTNTYSNVASTSYAYREVVFSEVTDYKLSFDWKSKGETSDYLYVYLAPASTDFTASTVSTTGWKQLGSKYYNKTDWQHQENVFSVLNDTSFFVVFRWYNNTTTQTQPPAAVDNIRIAPVSCPQPRNLTAVAHPTDVVLSWKSVGTESSWIVGIADSVWNDVADDSTYTVTGLDTNTLYGFTVRAFCDVEDTSLVTTITNVRTLRACPAPRNLKVDTVTTTEVGISWSAGYEETAWLLSINDSLVELFGDTSYYITDLTPNTSYTLKLFALCDNNDTSYSIQTRVHTLAGEPIDEYPYTCGFEITADGTNQGALWMLENQTNGWYIDTAARHGGLRGLYVSNDTGAHNTYAVGAGSVSYAYAVFSFEAGQYAYSFDWICNGESTWDYLRVAYAPLGTALPTAYGSWGSDATAPEGFTAIDGGKLNLGEEWQTKEGTFTVPSNGLYAFYFVWRNDGSQGSMPPAAIDNLMIDRLTCAAPTALHLDSIHANEAFLSWHKGGTETTWIVQANNGEWETATDTVYTLLNLTPSSDYVFKVASYCGEGDTSFALSVPGHTTDLCNPVAGLAVSAVTSESAHVQWTNVANVSWGYEYGPVGYEEGDGFTGTATTNSVDLTELTAGTQYEFRMWSICPEGNGPISTITFTTRGLPIDEFPYSTGFEAGDDVAWDMVNGGNAWFVGTAAHSANSSRALYIGNATANTYTMSSTCMSYAYRTFNISEAGQYRIKFDWKGTGESSWDYLRAWLTPATATYTANQLPDGTTAPYNYQTSTPAGWIDLGGKMNQQSAWQTSDNFVDLDAGQYNMVFMWANDGSSGANPPAAVDNVNFAQVTCVRPVAIVVDSLGSDAVALHWSPAGEEMNFEVVIDTNAPVLVTNDTVYTVTNLQPLTSHTIAVRAICGEGDTSLFTTGTFRTTCGPVTTLPYYEDFERYGDGSSNNIDSCWTKGSNSTTAYPYPYSTNAVSGTRSLYFYGTSTIYSYAALPAFTTPINQLMLSFKVRRYNNASYTTKLLVGVMSDPSDISTFETVRTVDLTSAALNSINEVEVFFNGYTGNGRYIAIYDATNATTSYAYVDSVTVNLAPSCTRPMDITLAAVDATSATVNVMAAAESNLMYVLRQDSILIDSSAMVSTTRTYTGLTPNTRYTLSVATLCPDGMTAASTFSFRTTYLGVDLPYSTGFEGTDAAAWYFENGTFTNKWVAGTATHSTGNQAIYISKDNGAHNTYDVSTQASVYAFKTFNVPAGQYGLSFDWNAYGESTYDYLRVFLVPGNVEITPVQNGIGTTGAPTGWISLDGDSKLNLASDWQNKLTLFNVPTAGVYNLVFYWRNDNSSGEQPPVAIDNVLFKAITCPIPTNFELDTTTATSAQFHWTRGGQETSWKVTVGNNAPVVVTDTFYNATGLDIATAYRVNIAAVCSENDESFGLAGNFITECGPYPVPYVEDFENCSSISDLRCWRFANGSNSSYPTRLTHLTGNENDRLLMMYKGGYFVTPEVATDLNTLELGMSYQTGGDSNYLVFGYLDSISQPVGDSIFVDTLWAYNYPVSGLGHRVYRLLSDAPASAKHVIIKSAPSGTNYFDFIGFVRLAAPRTCFDPTNIELTASTPTSATLSWNVTEGTTPSSYQVEYGPRFFIQGEGTVITTQTSSATINGLNNTIPYEAYVRSICGAGDTSDWSLAYEFMTECAPINVPVQYNFDEYVVVGSTYGERMPNCWAFDSASVDTANTGYRPVMYNSSNNIKLYMNAVDAVVAMPEMNADFDTLMASFYVTMGNNDALVVGTVASQAGAFGETFVPVDTVRYANAGHVDVYFVTYTGTNTHIAFKNISLAGSTTTSIYIDSVQIHRAPTCYPLRNVAVNDFGENFVTLDWNDYVSAGNWAIEYGAEGFTRGTGTTVNVTAHPATVTGLTPGTAYSFYITPVCSASDNGAVAGPVTMRTNCAPVTLPFLENFDSITTITTSATGVRPDCWNYIMTGTSTTATYLPQLYYSSSYASSGRYSLRLYGTAYTMLPPMPVALDSLELTFSHYKTSASEQLEVGVMEGTTFVPVQTINTPTSTHRDVTVYFNNYTGNSRVIAFRNFNGTSSYSTHYIDSVRVDYLSSCPMVLNVHASSASMTSVTLDWNTINSSAHSWQVEIGPAGHTLGATTANRRIVNNHPVTISGLDTATAYDVYVRPICSATDTGSWSDVASVTTNYCYGSVARNNGSGSSTTTGYSPIGYSLYDYSYVQTIIDSADMANISGAINTLGFRVTNDAGGDYFTGMYIYMANVSESNLSGGFIHPDANHDFVEVISDGNLNHTGNGWHYVTLDSSFTWDGHSNVLIASNRLTGEWGSTTTFSAHTSTVAKTRYAYQDNTPYDITDVTGGTASTTVGDIQLLNCMPYIPCDNPEIDTVIVGETEVTLSFAGTSDNYEVFYVEGDWIEPENGTLISDTDSYTFTGLTPAMVYSVGVRAVCAAGVYSEWMYQSITTEAHPCDVPTDLAASNVTLNSATLGWTNVEGQTAWQIAITGTDRNDIIDVTTKPYQVNGLTHGVTYTFTVRAICSEGDTSVWSAPATFTTRSCEGVTGVAVNSVTSNSAVVSWTAPAGATRFVVNYGTRGFDQGTGSFDTVENATSCTLTGLLANMPYDVYVRTLCDGNAASLWSVVAQFTTERAGIDDVANAAISLYPNPASSTVTLKGIEGKATVTVVDMNGRKAGEWTVSDGQLTIDVTEMAQGAYFVRIVGEQVNAIRKLIVR